MILALLALAVAAHPAPPRRAPEQTPERTGEYQSFRRCLSGVVRQAATDGVVPEDLLPRLRDACPDERAALGAMLARREAGDGGARKAAQAPADVAAGDQPHLELVNAWTNPLLVRAIRRYAIHYSTGRWIRE